MTLGKATNGSPDVKITLADLADRIGGTVEGDGARKITGVASLRDAGPRDVAFFAGGRHREDLSSTEAGAVIAGENQKVPGRDVVRVDNPYLAFALAIGIFFPPESPPAGVHPTAVVEDGAFVDPSATVAALCFVGSGSEIGARSVLQPRCFLGRETRIGADVFLHPGVTVLERVSVGDRVVVHSGTVIGSDGFGYVFDGEEHRKIPQVGGVDIGDDVEIGACVTIDRATLGSTSIGRGTKIDNLVQIAHNVEIGEKSVIVAQVGIAGSCRIGKGAVIGGQVAIAPHLHVGEGARLAARSGVLRNVPAGETMSGNGPLPHRQWLRSEAAFAVLPEMQKRLKELEKIIETLAGDTVKGRSGT